MSTSLPLFELPLQSGAPPTGFGWESHSEPGLSPTKRPFEKVLKKRDKFFGLPACVICGNSSAIRYCHIIPQDELVTWQDLKARGWIPPAATAVCPYDEPRNEPRNGLVLCPSHHANFNEHLFFIRFSPETEKFIFINYSNNPYFQQYHGKAIALDINDLYVPFASLFIIHEWRVRGPNPFQPIIPAIPTKITWQDWIASSGAYDNKTGFRRDSPEPPDNSNNISQFPALQFLHTSTSGASTSTGMLQALDNDVVAEILAATRAMPSWKACELDNMSWDGTAEENTKKYLDKSGGGLEE